MAIDETQLYTYIGSQIRQRRVELGLSQSSLGEAIGLLRTSITNIEAGRQRVPIHVLYQLCQVLDLEVSAVLPAVARGEQTRTVSIKVGEQTTEVSPKTAAFVNEVLAEE